VHSFVYVNFGDGVNTAPAPWTDNYFNSGEGVIGVLSADLLNDSGSPTGFGLEVTAPFDGRDGTVGGATADNVWPKEVYDWKWFCDGNDAAIRITGLPEGEAYSLEVAGHTLNSIRNTEFTVDGSTTLYDNAGSGVPNPPITFNGVVTGGVIDISISRTSFFGYFNGFKLHITRQAILPAGGSIISPIVQPITNIELNKIATMTNL